MLKDFNAVKITVASPEDILNWSHGEVTKAETINYRTFKPEPGGLMAEEIFGPSKDFECYCGKYKKVRYKGIVCDRCGVEVTHKRVRRERMGHIKLATPVCHVWFSHGLPNRLSLILDIPQKKLETVIYYARYVVTGVNDEEKDKTVESLPSFMEDERKSIESELEFKISELNETASRDIEEIKKTAKTKDKINLQIERYNNNLKKESAMLKSAFNQKIENLEKKFAEIKTIIQGIKVGSTLSEEEFQLLDSYGIYFFDAGMGSEAVKDLLNKIDLPQELELLEVELANTKSELRRTRLMQRIKILEGLNKSGVSPSWLVLEVLPVIPPDIRPIVQLPGGRFATYDLNDLYRRVVNRNNRLKRLIALGAPEIILRNEKRMLQESVDSLFDNLHKPGAPSLNTRQLPFKSLSDMLRGKQGRFRQNLLGKRVDYSGNAVIVPGPELNFDQCGLPKIIALEIFRPFVIRELIGRGLAANPAKAKLLFEQKIEEVWDILDEVIKGRPVLLNRAPSLHKQSIIAFYPILIEGNAIRLHPMVCKGFNADFDGDQMAVYLPLSDKAVEEVKERMFARHNMLNLRDGVPIVSVEKDMAMGVYLLTRIEESSSSNKFYSNIEEVITSYHLGEISFNTPVKVLIDGKIEVSTAGRGIFNKILPDGHEYLNKAFSKSDITKLTSELFSRYGRDKAIESLDKIKELGFKYAGRSGFSVSMEDFRFGGDKIVSQFVNEFESKEDELLNLFEEGYLTKNELKWKSRDLWMEYSEKIQDSIWIQAKEKAKNLINLNDSGALSVKTWVERISGVQGFVTDPSGAVVELPLKSNFDKGFSNFEYFVSARGARKGFADVALRTADSGYLTRRLVDVCQDIITTTYDCGTKEGIYISRSEKRNLAFGARIKGRVACEDVINPVSKEILIKANEEITPEVAKKIDVISEIQQIKVRSGLTCEVSHGICTKCYGYDNGTGALVDIGEAVGIVAAQSLGEPTTQLTLQSKSGARASKTDVTQGLPRVEELLEARSPKALAILSEIDGVATIVDGNKGKLIRITSETSAGKKYELSKEIKVHVQNGGKVNEGDLILSKGKKEVKAEFAGKIKLDSDALYIQGKKRIEVEYELENDSVLAVQDGEEVTKGQQLTLGSIDPKQLFSLKSLIDAQKYIITGVLDVYSIYGMDVDDRHLEIVTRQMARYGLVNDSGDSELYLYGDFVDVLDLKKENMNLESNGKKPVKYDRVLMGITNSSIRTESFLAAASFEQQVRVLTEAALIGKVDHLRGLKENVIIGRPVPLASELKRKLGLIKDEVELENTEQQEYLEEKSQITDKDVQRIM